MRACSSSTAFTRPASRPRRNLRSDRRRPHGALPSAARAPAPPCPTPASFPMAAPSAFVFDAYGTLFDVHSIVEAGRLLTADPQALSNLWRQKQLEYTWLLSLMGRYEDFWAVTEKALRFALARLNIAAGERQVHALLDSYLSLACFPEVETTLARLGSAPLAILSNGSPRMLDAVVNTNGLGRRLHYVLSVDAVGVYKPSPRVYELGPRSLGIPAREALFVSSNAWDIAEAKAFGYLTCWCNRAGAPMDTLGLVPDLEVDRLDQIPPARAR